MFFRSWGTLNEMVISNEVKIPEGEFVLDTHKSALRDLPVSFYLFVDYFVNFVYHYNLFLIGFKTLLTYPLGAQIFGLLLSHILI